MDVVQSHTLHRTHFCQYYMNLISYTGGTTGDCQRLLEATGAHWEPEVTETIGDHR